MTARKLALTCLVGLLGCATAPEPVTPEPDSALVALRNVPLPPALCVEVTACSLDTSGRPVLGYMEEERGYSCAIANNTGSSRTCTVLVECVRNDRFLGIIRAGSSLHEVRSTTNDTDRWTGEVVCSSLGASLLRVTTTCGGGGNEPPCSRVRVF